jgi:serine/threonine protein kinase
MAEDEEFIEMFIDEAKISGQLSHPNIGQIFELGEIDGSYFIAMEYVWGKDVLQIQNRFRRNRQQMPLPMAAFIASRVCEGLDYAHRKKDENQTPLHIIHRDVSPQNVLVSYSGDCKIIDFGIAKARSRSSKTQAGVLKGKFGYMSPEQVRALPLDQRSDIFSIGTILYEMATSERLFTGESDFATLEKVRNAIVPTPSKLNPLICPELEAIMLKALKSDPDERYQWASEMQEDLANFLMDQNPIFSTKNLADIVSKLFEKERLREQEAMEEYKNLRLQDMDAVAHGASFRREMAISMLPQGPPVPPQSVVSMAMPAAYNIDLVLKPEPLEDECDYEDDSETQQGVPSFFDGINYDGLHLEPDPLARRPAPHGESNTSLEGDGKTEIFGNSPPALRAEETGGDPTYIFNMEAGKMEKLADQPTVIFANQPAEMNSPAPSVPETPEILFEVNLESVADSPGGITVSVPPLEREKSHLAVPETA